MQDGNVPHHVAAQKMPYSPYVDSTPADWDTLFDQYLESGLSQIAFCKEQVPVLPHHLFSYRYRRSEKYAGIRKGSAHTKKTHDPQGSGFRRVHKKPATVTQPIGEENISIYLGENIRLQCPATVGVEAIVRLARETR